MTINYHKLHAFFSRTLVVALMIMTAVSANAFNMSHYSDTSRLATGKWVKIEVSQSGIYQITSSDASKWGFNDLSRVRVFGYGGSQLSETLNEENFIDDLPQVPVLRSGDRILFYAYGPLTWNWSSTNNIYLQSQHPYATKGYYFVTDDSSYSDLSPTTSQPALSGSVVTSFNERLFHEEELINPGETGRVLLGEDFLTNNSQSFKFTLDGMVDGTTVNVFTRFAAKTLNTSSSVSFKYNGNNLAGTHYIDGITSDANHYHYNVVTALKQFTLNGTKDLTYTVTYTPGGTLNLARLDYITVNYERNLDLNGKSSLAFGLASLNDSQYELSGVSSNTHVWDVTSKTTLLT